MGMGEAGHQAPVGTGLIVSSYQKSNGLQIRQLSKFIHLIAGKVWSIKNCPGAVGLGMNISKIPIRRGSAGWVSPNRHLLGKETEKTINVE